MFEFFANLFGYLLNALYTLVQNYGGAIILFSFIIKIVLLPISIKQQRTMKKTAKIQGKLKEIQLKYKNNPEKQNQATLELYKSENMSPFSGCLSSIIQMILILSVFYLVRSPLTYMKKVDAQVIENYTTQITESGQKTGYPEIVIIEKMGSDDENVYINMNFLGLNLSNIPTQKLNDPSVYVIPVLYIISSFISMKISSQMKDKEKKEKEIIIVDDDKKEEDSMEVVNQVNKRMTYMLPIMSVIIALVAPLGLALYWLVNNIFMIIERVLLNRFLKKEEEE